MIHPGVCPAWYHILQECCSFALFSAMVLGCPGVTRLFFLQSAGPHKLLKQFCQELPLPSTPNTQGRLCQFCSLQCWKMLLNDTDKPGVPFPHRGPRKARSEGEKHFPAQGKDASSKQGAPHTAWQRLGAPKQTHPQAFACQFPFPVELQV